MTSRTDAEHFTLAVHNVGLPVSAALLPRLFQPLRRGDGHDPNKSRSIGLGLFIVKHLVDAHGGTIAVDSTADRGTTFTVRLPRGIQQP